MYLPACKCRRCNASAKKKQILHSTVELDHAVTATTAMELLLKAAGTDGLTLGEGSQGQRQGKERGGQDKTQVDGQDHARASPKPLGLLQADKNQRGKHHDGSSVQDTTDGCLTDSDGSGLLTLAQTLQRFSILHLLALGTILIGQDRVDIDTLADLLTTHEEDVQGTGTGDGSEGDKAGEDKAGVGGDALQARDQCVKTQGDGAGSGNSHAVGLGDLGVRQGGRLVGVGVVDCNVERLVTDLP